MQNFSILLIIHYLFWCDELVSWSHFIKKQNPNDSNSREKPLWSIPNCYSCVTMTCAKFGCNLIVKFWNHMSFLSNGIITENLLVQWASVHVRRQQLVWIFHMKSPNTFDAKVHSTVECIQIWVHSINKQNVYHSSWNTQRYWKTMKVES